MSPTLSYTEEGQVNTTVKSTGALFSFAPGLGEGIESNIWLKNGNR